MLRPARPLLGVFLALCCGFVVSLAQDASDPLVGVFSNSEMTAVIKTDKQKYVGTITFDGQNFSFNASKKGETGLAGTFADGGEVYQFSGNLDDGTLILKTGDSTYALRKAPTKRNPLDRTAAKSGAVGSSEQAESVAPAPNDWKSFRHPTGVSLKLPGDWKVQESPDGSGYLLLPPGVVPGGEELYIVGGQPVGDIASAEDPRLAAAAEALMAQAGPLLERKGAVEKVRAAGTPGISLVWESSQGARARMFVTVLKGQAVGITGIGLKEKVAEREDVLLKIFKTLSAGEASLDNALVGSWKRMGTTTIDARDNVGRLQASSAGDHHHTVQLRADGTCVSRESSRTIAIGQGVALDTGDQVTNKSGRWNAADGKLVLIWDGGQPEEVGYRLSGPAGNRQLIIKLGSSNAQVWAETR